MLNAEAKGIKASPSTAYKIVDIPENHKSTHRVLRLSLIHI